VSEEFADLCNYSGEAKETATVEEVISQFSSIISILDGSIQSVIGKQKKSGGGRRAAIISA